MTKFEALMDYLTDLVDTTVLEKLAINYYNSQNSSTYTTEDGDTYHLFTQEEIDEQLFEIAEDYFYDYMYNLERMAEEANTSKERTSFQIILEAVDVIEAQTALSKKLDLAEEKNYSEITEIGKYTIFLDD